MKRYFFCHLIILCNVIVPSFLPASHVDVSYKSQISIRLATNNDLQSIIALDISISDEYFKPLLLQYPEFEGKEHEVEKMLATEIESDTAWFISCIAMEKQQRLYIAYENSTPIGFVACHKQDDTTVVIDLLMIDASCRGKGIGKQFIRTCMQMFPETSVCMIVVLDKNKQARTAYEKMGFVLMEEKPTFVQEKYPESRYLCYTLSAHPAWAS